MRQGIFISLEGGEGAGKSTQLRRLSDRLSQTGIKNICTREPGGTAGAEEIRNLLVRGDAARWTPKTEALLMYAARQEHVEEVIKPALARGQWVLCDRFADSSMAYQGIGHGLGIDRIAALNQWVLEGFQPDMTLILDLPVSVGLSRTEGHAVGENRFEGMDVAFHERMRQGFLSIARANPERCTVIDATTSAEVVAENIWNAVVAKTAKANPELES
ncbi:dTMP kinase [Kiloniella laminariae]|uniref:Thymidylate kinase n=1 Tax=Kiloniella laminariae TaxID=454162 RepID=A0ABT4LLA8_9PROT|nr:dTMP kinase [Kiloniella laminariae]MCZ4281902.1 dTMP kinase [Kiloniella laminariae]